MSQRGWASRYDQPIFGMVTAKRIDRLGPLSHRQIPRPKHHRAGLLCLTLQCHKTHRRPLRRLADRLGISHVILLAFNKGLHIRRRDQLDVALRAIDGETSEPLKFSLAGAGQPSWSCNAKTRRRRLASRPH